MHRRHLTTAMHNQRGMALLIALAVIALLMTAALAANRQSRTEAGIAATYRDRMMLYDRALSAIHIAMAVLVRDRTDSSTDSPAEQWADTEYLSAVMDASISAGGIRLVIEDEKSRISVNALLTEPGGNTVREAQWQLWEHFLSDRVNEDLEATQLDPAEILNSLKDWLDAGDAEAVTGLTGAESDYYRELTPGYMARNGPMPHESDLLRVRGVSPALYHGSPETPGLSRYVSVTTETGGPDSRPGYYGRININTASQPVIRAMLPPERQELAEAIVEFRDAAVERSEIDRFSNKQWYKDAPGCGDLVIPPSLITVSSDLFRIESTAEENDMHLTLSAIVQRVTDPASGNWHCKLLRLEPS